MLDQGPQNMPPGYLPPDQVKQMYDYSQGLTKGGMRDDTITSPWQGARMMADALAGRSMRNQAGQAQAGNTFGAGADLANVQRPGAQSPIPGLAPGAPSGIHDLGPQGSFGGGGTPTPPVKPIMSPPQMSASPPLPGLGGSVPSSMPGGVPGGPAGMVGGMQPPQPPMGGQPPNPMMQALMSPPPGMGMG